MSLRTAAGESAGASRATMRAAVYRGLGDVRVEERPRPRVVEPTDAVVRVTTAGICGSDLHLYRYPLAGLGEPVVLGHEAVGVVEETGGAVHGVRPGDRVAVSGAIADGTCRMCRDGLYSQCETTLQNPLPGGVVGRLASAAARAAADGPERAESRRLQEALWGHHKGALLGLGPALGGLDGAQATHVRVPFADTNLLRLPDGVRDEQGVFLSDVLPVAYMGTELGGVGPESTVAVWGCGPVGLLALASARARGAEHLVAVDHHPERLAVARDRLGADVVDFGKEDVVARVKALTGGRGPDVAIDCVGFRNARRLRHRVQYALKLETDSLDVIADAMRVVRSGGTVVVVGAYLGFANQFPVGALMERELTLRGSAVNPQRYWTDLSALIEGGQLDPSFVVTHRFPLERAADAYRLYDRREDGAIKVLLEP